MLPLPSSVKPGKYVFQTGFLVSFLASLPPGITNIVTVRLSMTGDYMNASLFALGIMTAEIIYAKFCSTLMNHMFRSQFIVRIFQGVVLLILTAMAILSFIASARERTYDTGDLVAGNFPPFVFGFLLMAINPVQIPFWLGWTTILLEKKILDSNQHGQLSYLLGIGLGSLLASIIFITLGSFLLSWVAVGERALHFIFGGIFTIMALVHVRKVSQ
jgi:threonine/homoserine/homoserine lactone efflux protein